MENNSSASLLDASQKQLPLVPMLKFTSWFDKLKQHFTIREASGSLGDLGTFLPMITALAATGSINFAVVLFWSAVHNFMAGCVCFAYCNPNSQPNFSCNL